MSTMSDLDARMQQWGDYTANRRLIEMATHDPVIWPVVKLMNDPDTASPNVLCSVVDLIREHWEHMPVREDMTPERREYVELEWFAPPDGVLVEAVDEWPVTFVGYRVYQKGEI